MRCHRSRVLGLLLGMAWLLSAGCGDTPPPAPAGGLEPASAARPPALPRTNPWTRPEHVSTFPLRLQQFEPVALPEALGTKRTTCVLVEPQQLVVGTERGVAIRTGDAWRVYGTADGLGHAYVTSLAREASTGALWIGTLAGLSRLSGGEWQTWHQTDSGLINDVVYHVVAQGGRIWIATAAGTSVFNPRTETWTLWNQDNTIMHEPWCYALARGAGRTWIGVWGGGIVERDDATGRWHAYRDPDGEMELDLIRDDGPIHDVTSFVAYEAGVLWQATYFGLSRYDGHRWQTYTAADTGLPSDFIHHVATRGQTAALSTDDGWALFDGETCVAYRRRPDGRCDVTVTRAGHATEAAVLATAPTGNYVLWSWLGDREVWLATDQGLCHGTTEPTPEGAD